MACEARSGLLFREGLPRPIRPCCAQQAPAPSVLDPRRVTGLLAPRLRVTTAHCPSVLSSCSPQFPATKSRLSLPGSPVTPPHVESFKDRDIRTSSTMEVVRRNFICGLKKHNKNDSVRTRNYNTVQEKQCRSAAVRCEDDHSTAIELMLPGGRNTAEDFIPPREGALRPLGVDTWSHLTTKT